MNAQEVVAARCKTGIQALFPECTRRIDIELEFARLALDDAHVLRIVAVWRKHLPMH